MGVFDFVTDTLFGGSEQDAATVDSAQAPFLQFLREQAQTSFEGFSGQQTDAGFGTANDLFGVGRGIVQQQQQLGGGIAASQIESLSDILNRNLSFNLQQIGLDSAQGNTFGGGRQGVAQGQAIGDTQLALGVGASQILGQQQQQQQNLLGQLGGLFDLSQAGFRNQQQPLRNLADIIGPSTVLGGGGSSSGGILSNIGLNIG